MGMNGIGELIRYISVQEGQQEQRSTETEDVVLTMLRMLETPEIRAICWTGLAAVTKVVWERH